LVGGGVGAGGGAHLRVPVSVVSGSSRLPITRSAARDARTAAKKPLPSAAGSRPGALPMTMSPVADSVIAAFFDAGGDEPAGVGTGGDGLGAADRAACQRGPATSPLRTAATAARPPTSSPATTTTRMPRPGADRIARAVVASSVHRGADDTGAARSVAPPNRCRMVKRHASLVRGSGGCVT
jgi:hypothetical protein